MEITAKCTQCHQDFNITDHYFEREVFLEERLVLTVLVCPHCQHEVVTQVDNTDTLRLFQRQLKVIERIGRTISVKKKATPIQEERRDNLTKALIAARQELNGKYNHTSYQFDGKEHKLDIHVPNMRISEET